MRLKKTVAAFAVASSFLVSPSFANELIMTCEGNITYKHIEKDLGQMEFASEFAFKGLQITQEGESYGVVHSEGPGKGAYVAMFYAEDCLLVNSELVRCSRAHHQGPNSWRMEYIEANSSSFLPEFELMVVNQNPESVPFQTQSHFVGTCK